MSQAFPPEVCSVCKNPNHSMSLEKRRLIEFLRRHHPNNPSPLLPEEYHSNQSKVQTPENKD